MLHLMPNIRPCVMQFLIHAIMPMFRMYRDPCHIVVYLLRRDLAIGLDSDVLIGLEGVDLVCRELGTVYQVLVSWFEDA